MPIKFVKNLNNPVISRKYNSFYGVHVANPDILEYGDKYYMYFRGQGIEGHDQIAVASCERDKFDAVTWKMYENNPIIKVDTTKKTFDNQHILDPASIIIGGKVFLYYAGHSNYQKPGIGLAISSDGMNFEKYSDSPVIDGAMSPEIVLHNNCYYLFYSKLSEQKNLDIYFSKSIDGINFDIQNEVKIFSPSGIKSSFDSFSISTVRIIKVEDYYFMIYGGCSKYFDYPSAFGLARSKDLINWERCPDNPIMERGNPGEWDEGAIWFGTTICHDNNYYLYYEGVGAGLGINTPEGLECSNICRNEDYGGYRKFSFSQIGLAAFTGKLNW